MKVIDLQPRQVVGILELTMDEILDISDSLEGVAVNEKGSGALKAFCTMLNKLLDEFDHGITRNS